eukprot:358710-Chlamydomonas_euryale.AAC.1
MELSMEVATPRTNQSAGHACPHRRPTTHLRPLVSLKRMCPFPGHTCARWQASNACAHSNATPAPTVRNVDRHAAAQRAQRAVGGLAATPACAAASPVACCFFCYVVVKVAVRGACMAVATVRSVVVVDAAAVAAAGVGTVVATCRGGDGPSVREMPGLRGAAACGRDGAA